MISGKPLSILVGADAPPDPNSGAAGTVFATSVALRALGHSVDEFWSGDLPHRIPHWNLHYLFELPRAYRAAVRSRASSKRFDVIQLSQPQAWLAACDHKSRRSSGILVNRSHGLESLADAALIQWHQKLGVPPNAFPRSLFSPMLRRGLHRHIDLVVKYADGMIVPSSDIRDHLVAAHGADPARVAVIYHGVPDRFIDRPRAPLTPVRLKRILHVGQYSFIKGTRLMVRAVEEAFGSDRELTFSWVCSHEHHADAIALFRPEFRSRVLMTNWCSQEALLKVYDAHGLFIAHSVYEGAAKACTEALARGLVLISSAVGALKDHVRHGSNGFLAEVGDVSAMANFVVESSNRHTESVRVGLAAARTVEGMTWRACAVSSVDFYRHLLCLKL